MSKQLSINQFNSVDEISVGDLIVKLSGKKPIEVTGFSGFNSTYVNGRYVDSGSTVCEKYHYFKPYENKKQTIMNKQQLFTWTDSEGQHYGTYLATNSSGQYVIEEKQTGNIVTMSVDDVEEVIPWTFSAKLDGLKEKHFTGPDTIKKGDVLLQIDSRSSNSKIWIVTDVNTKNKTATKFVGRRVVTEEI